MSQKSIPVLSPTIQIIFAAVTLYAFYEAYQNFSNIHEYAPYVIISIGIILLVLIFNPRMATAKAKASVAFVTS